MRRRSCVLNHYKEVVEFRRKDLEKKIQDQISRCSIIEGSYENAKKNSQKTNRAIIVIEGWDGSGKSGIASRLMQGFTPDKCRVWHMTKPIEYEHQIHHLYSFWQKLPGPGTFSIFDRSWYGRVIFQQISQNGGTATEADGIVSQQEFYRTINEFEKMLVGDGVRIAKVFLNIDMKTLKARLEERVRKSQYNKLTVNDFEMYRNYDYYQERFDTMLRRTDSAAQWEIVDATDRNWARYRSLKYVLDTISDGFEEPDQNFSPDVRNEINGLFPGLLEELERNKIADTKTREEEQYIQT